MRGMRGEEVDRFVDVHREHVADALPRSCTSSVSRLKRRPPQTSQQHLHVRQEAHLDRLLALALAGGAAAAAGVEAEASGAVAAHARFAGVGEQPADRVPEADVGGRTRARRLADRRLVDFEHAGDDLPAVDRLDAGQRRRRLALVARVDLRGHVGQQHVARERRLAGTRHAGDDGHAAQRHARVDVAQVVQVGAAQRQPVLAVAGGSARGTSSGCASGFARKRPVTLSGWAASASTGRWR